VQKVQPGHKVVPKEVGSAPEPGGVATPSSP
jgi:hypothetical protein